MQKHGSSSIIGRTMSARTILINYQHENVLHFLSYAVHACVSVRVSKLVVTVITTESCKRDYRNTCIEIITLSDILNVSGL